jgi:hypothetical protein
MLLIDWLLIVAAKRRDRAHGIVGATSTPDLIFLHHAQRKVNCDQL